MTKYMKFMALISLVLISALASATDITVSADDGYGTNVSNSSEWSVEWLPIPGVNVSMACDPNPALWATNCTCKVTNSGDSTLYNVTATDDTLGAIPVPNQLAPGQSGQATVTVLRPEGSEMTDIDKSISESGDDGGWDNGDAFDTSGSSLFVGQFTGVYYYTYLRFQGITLPEGAIIDNAYIRLYPSMVMGTPTARIQAVNSSNASQPTDYASINGATLTTAYVDWALPATTDEYVTSSSLVSIFDELLSDYGSLDNASVVLTLKNFDTGDYMQVSNSYDAGSNVPLLHITYHTASGSPMYAYAQLQ
jgi:hypothetical protein